jgi:hypothetical protein
MQNIPTSLRYWFTVHFVIDLGFAIPLLFFTDWFLLLLGLDNTNLLQARLVAAALVAIGGTSLLMRHADAVSYILMLKFKILWSGSAILAIVLSLHQGTAQIAWLLLVIFTGFFVVWLYYLRMLLQKPLH